MRLRITNVLRCQGSLIPTVPIYIYVLWLVQCHLNLQSARRGMNTPGRRHFLKYKNKLSLWQDIRQNQWTMKDRSLTHIYFTRSIFVSHWSITPNTIFLHQIILKILSKITRPLNIGHVDLYLIWGQSLCYTVSLSENMTLIRQIVLEIWGKITRPWNIGHSDLPLFLGQMSGNTDP